MDDSELIEENNQSSLLDEAVLLDDTFSNTPAAKKKKISEDEPHVKWPKDDTLFSYVVSANGEDHLEENEDQSNCNVEAEEGIPNTQRFIDDLMEKVELQNCLQSQSITGSQYVTRAAIRNNSLLNKNESLKNEINALADIPWNSQSFVVGANSKTEGPFYGLSEQTERLIYEYKGIKSLYDWQKECLSLPAIANRQNLIYALPTSGGKTLVAEILMLKEIICREKNVLFILPYVSIVQEKVSALAPFASKYDFLVEEYTAGRGRCPPQKRRTRRSIYVASIEKGAVLCDSLIEAGRANEIGLVVIDELHLIGESMRGHTLESFLTKVMFIKAGIQIVGMSATIGNLPELSDFLNADVYTRGFRPVELREYIKYGNDILSINPTNPEQLFTPERTVKFKYNENVTKMDPDHLAGLVWEVAPLESVLVFCSTRKNCENVAILLSRVLPRKKYIEHRKNEKVALMDAIEKLCGTLSPVLSQTIPYGIAYHHSGLTTDERKIIETAYRFGTICVICCTSTLAAGVNLPAKRVIIRSPYVGRQSMTQSKYKQMIGRAGRAGMGLAGESILICLPKDHAQVAKMLFSPMDNVKSSLKDNEYLGLQSLVISAIGLKLAECRKDLVALTENTLLAIQAEDLGVNVTKEVNNILRVMFRHKILEAPNIKASNIDEMVTTQEVNQNESVVTKTVKNFILNRSTKFGLTPIGMAAFKAGIDYKTAQSIYSELKLAQKSLVLRNLTHLLYLTTSHDGALYPDPSVFYKEFSKIDEDTQLVAQAIGITEVHIVKMIKTQSLKGPMECQMNRFFKVLILNEVINLTPLHLVGAQFSIERGWVQNLISQSISSTGGIIRLCDQMEDLWCFKPLFEHLVNKLDHCCIAELTALLDLPAVKINRAKQLYAAGFKTLEDLAKAKVQDLVNSIEHLPFRVAREIVSASRIILLNKLELLQEETEAIVNCLK